MIVYVAGPYRAKTIFGVITNILRARRTAIKLWQHGYVAICPHLNTALFDTIFMAKRSWMVRLWMFLFGNNHLIGCRQFLDGDLEILSICDAICMVKVWIDSEGTKEELMYAEDNGLQVFENVEQAIL